MIVSKSTKISKIIKENSKAIETIASINPHFRKLKNPILRRVLAPRVTVADAAKIGNVSVENFLEKLVSIGFEIEISSIVVKDNSTKKEELIMKLPTKSLDVRPIIEAGTDPFKQLIEITKKLNVGEVLEVINSFEPIPLINILSKKGFKTQTVKKENLICTYFEKISESEVIGGSSDESNEEFDSVYKTFIGKMDYVDVRALEMPEPMTTILGRLVNLPEENCLLVDHKKIPQFLLPELKERNFDILYNKKSETHIQLLIFKKK